jgi:hypothetical protein
MRARMTPLTRTAEGPTCQLADWLVVGNRNSGNEHHFGTPNAQPHHLTTSVAATPLAVVQRTSPRLWSIGLDGTWPSQRPLSFHAGKLPRNVMWYADPSGANEQVNSLNTGRANRSIPCFLGKKY